MTHPEYKKAIDADRKYVDQQLEASKKALEKAKTDVEYWTRQSEAMSAVSARVSMSENSAFDGKKVSGCGGATKI